MIKQAYMDRSDNIRLGRNEWLYLFYVPIVALLTFDFRSVMRIMLAISVILMVVPARSAAGQEDESSQPPQLVLKWKWGGGSTTTGMFDQP